MKKTLVTLGACVAFAAAAHAQLGQTVQNASSPAMARAFAQSSVPWMSASSKDANGVAITQYVNQQGVVFAVSWNGPVKPNLKALLGSYFSVDKSANPLGHVAARTQGDLVVYSSGSMPHFEGYAYLKSDVPAGFTFN